MATSTGTLAQIVCVLATVHTTLSSPITASVPSSESSQHPTSAPQYRFQYYIRDERTGDFKTQDETRNGETVHGSYTVADPNGDVHTVTYTADVGNGFQAVVNMQPRGSPFIKTQQMNTASSQQHNSNKDNLQHQFHSQEPYPIPMVKAQDHGSGTTISIPTTVIQSKAMQEYSDQSNRAAIMFEVKMANVSDTPTSYSTHNTQATQVKQTSGEGLDSLPPQIFPINWKENTNKDYGSKIKNMQHLFRQPNNSTHVEASYEDRHSREEKHITAESSPSSSLERTRQKVTPNKDKHFEQNETLSLHSPPTDKVPIIFPDGPQLVRKDNEESEIRRNTSLTNLSNSTTRYQNKARNEENNEESLRSLLMNPESLKAIGIDPENIEFGPGSLSMAEKLASSNSHLKLVQSVPQHTTHIISPSDIYGRLRNPPRSLKQTNSEESFQDSFEVPKHAYVSVSPLTTVLLHDSFQAQLNTTPLKIHRIPSSFIRQASSPQGKSFVSPNTSSLQQHVLPSKPNNSMMQQYYTYPMESFLRLPSQYSTIPYPMTQYPYLPQGIPYSPSVAFVRTIVMPVTDVKDGR